MPVVASTLEPSKSNMNGGIAGLATTIAIEFLTKAGYLALAASAIGVPEATLEVLATGLIAMGANMLITHISELKNADKILRALETVKIEADYTGTGNDPLPPVTTNIKTADGSNVGI